ncbi:MAG: fluoride efflux transporter CrcB [Burkholderiales bacterium]|jgi:CrcB protein|nr:fluoride efflux transporter CrcB [Burkholderiales bacterium]
MFWYHLLGVSFGAAVGATLRWGLSYTFNEIIPNFPLGTLLCNLIGGLAIGVALALFLTHDWSDAWRHFVVTGLLGGLTTFSTFSAEISLLLMRSEYLVAMFLAFSHLLGSLLLTIIGFTLVCWITQ